VKNVPDESCRDITPLAERSEKNYKHRPGVRTFRMQNRAILSKKAFDVSLLPHEQLMAHTLPVDMLRALKSISAECVARMFFLRVFPSPSIFLSEFIFYIFLS
jgi:hypothetical protein